MEGRDRPRAALFGEKRGQRLSESNRKREKEKKDKQDCFGWILHMTKNVVFELVGGLIFYAALTRKVTSQKILFIIYSSHTQFPK